MHKTKAKTIYRNRLNGAVSIQQYSYATVHFDCFLFQNREIPIFLDYIIWFWKHVYKFKKINESLFNRLWF